MKREHNSGSMWGPALIIVALLMVAAGYIGAPICEKEEKDRRRSIANRDYQELKQIWEIHSSQLKRDLRNLGPQEFRPSDVTSVGFDLALSDELTDLVGSIVEATTSDIVERFPGRQYVVKARLRFYGYGTSTVHEFDHPGWFTMSPGLPEVAINEPGVFFSSAEQGDHTLDIVHFMAPEGVDDDESKRAWYILDLFFRSSPLKRIGVAGNEYPIGAPAEMRLVCNLELREIPVGILGIMADVLNRIGLLGLLLLLVSPPVWVYLDARKRRLPALLWGLFALLTSALGALIYALVTREAGPTCPECGERVSTRFVVCPYCQTELKGTCSTCGQTVGLNWHYCPSCATEL